MHSSERKLSLVGRFLKGTPGRKSRLHDYSGKFVDMASLAYLPASVATALQKKLTGRMAPLPWLGFRVLRRLEKILDQDSRVLEFGAGMSTQWLAPRCGHITSIETDESWFETVSINLKEKHLDNVSLIKRSAEKNSELKGLTGPYDLVIVDGLNRDQCAVSATKLVKPGGFILLDNCDVMLDEHQKARRTLLDWARNCDGKVEFFCDLPPHMIQACESMIVQNGD